MTEFTQSVTTMIVGDRNPTGGAPFPETSRSGSWLREAVAALPIAVALDNLYVPQNGEAPHLVEPSFRLNVELLTRLRCSRLTVLALGDDVSQELTRQGVPHHRCPHPAWHRRYRGAERPDGYARRLASALGVPLNEPTCVW